MPDETGQELFLLTINSHGLGICGIFADLAEAQRIAQEDENLRCAEWNDDLADDTERLVPAVLVWTESRPGKWSSPFDEGHHVHAYSIRKLLLNEEVAPELR